MPRLRAFLNPFMFVALVLGILCLIEVITGYSWTLSRGVQISEADSQWIGVIVFAILGFIQGLIKILKKHKSN